LYYHHFKVSIVGYPDATASLAWRIAHDGYYLIMKDMVRSFFYQFSYVFIGSWGMIGVGTFFLAQYWQRLTPMVRYTTFFIMLSSLGLIALCAIGMASYTILDYRMPQGRYFSLLFPLIVTLSLYLLFQVKLQKKQDMRLLLIVIFATTLIAIIATPLYVRSPVAFTSMPELSPIIHLSDGGRIVWRATIEEPAFLLRMSVALFFGIFALFIVALRHHRYIFLLAACIISVGSVFSSFTENDYTSTIGESQSSLNDLYIYLWKKNINIEQVRFDKKLEVGNAQFLTPFWLNEVTKYSSVAEILKPSKQAAISYFISEKELALSKLHTFDHYVLYKVAIEGAK